MSKTKVAEKLVDLILDGKYNRLKKVDELTESYLNKLKESVNNVIPEVPDEGKAPGKDVKKELENEKTSVKPGANPIDNAVPQVPDEGKTPGAAIKKDISEAEENEIAEVPDAVAKTKKDTEKEVASGDTSVKTDSNPIDNKTPQVPDEGKTPGAAIKKDIEESLAVSDFQSFFDGLKSKGLTDEKKFTGMLKKAESLAKEQGKEGDKKTIVGILQRFMSGS